MWRAILVVLVAAVSVNSFLYFEYFLPQTATAAPDSSPPTERSDPSPSFEGTQGAQTTVRSTPPTTVPESTQRTHPLEMTATSTASATPMDVLQRGEPYVFNGSTSHIAVPDTDGLDPKASDITLAARVKVNGESLDDDSYDVVRKGLVDTPGGYYKMEIKRIKADPTVGKLHCLFRGREGTVDRVAWPDIVDGGWHTLECAKTDDKVVAKVDGKAYKTTGSAGSIANKHKVMVGAKEVNPRPDDMFDGSMDFVSIEIAQPDIAQ